MHDAVDILDTLDHRRPPWLADLIIRPFGRCRQRILVVTDGLTFDAGSFGLSEFLADLANTWFPPIVSTQVHSAGGFTFELRTTACIDIVETITKVINGFTSVFEEVCDLVTVLRPLEPSLTRGRAYRLPDGTIRWISEAEWFELYDRAASDPAGAGRTTSCSGPSASSSAPGRASRPARSSAPPSRRRCASVAARGSSVRPGDRKKYVKGVNQIGGSSSVGGE